MRFGMSSVRGAGATAATPHGLPSNLPGQPPPAPGLVQNAQGQWGHYEIPQGSEVTTWVPYAPPQQPTQQAPMQPMATIRSGGECPPGTAWGPDPTGRSEFACIPVSNMPTAPTGDTTPGRTSPTGSQSIPRVPPILPTVRQVIPCAPNWTPRAYGGSNLKPPSLTQAPVTYLAGAGAAGFHGELTFADVLGWGALALGLLVGQQLIDNIYDRRRAA